MSDVTISSETTNDTSDFLAGITKSKDTLADFANYANGLKITPQFEIDTNTFLGKARQAFSQLQSDAVQEAQRLNSVFSSLNSVQLKLDTTQASQQITQLLNQIQNVTMTLNVPNAAQIGTDIGNAAGAAFLNSVAGWNPGGGGGGGGGGSGSGGGGGGGGGRGRMMGFGRVLMPLFVMHQLVRAQEIGSQYDESYTNAHGDVDKELDAEIKKRHEQDSLMMGAGRVMRGIREMYDPTTLEGLENQKRDNEDSKRNVDVSQASAEFGLGIRQKMEIATTRSGKDRERVQQSIERDNVIKSINKQADKDVENADTNYKIALNKAQKIEDDAGSVMDPSNYRDEKKFAKIRADSMRDAAKDAHDRAVGAIRGDVTHGITGSQKTALQQEDATYQAKLKEINDGDPIQNAYAAATNQIQIGETAVSATEAQMRMAGNQRGAKDYAFKEKQKEELDKLQAQRNQAVGKQDWNEVYRLDSQIDAKKKADPVLLAEQQQNENREEAYKAAQSKDRIANIGVSVQSAQMRAEGRGQEAGNLDYQNALDNKVKVLEESAKAMGPGIEAEQKYAEARAQSAANEKLIAARKAEQARAIELEIKAEAADTEATNLRADGRNWEAGESQRKKAYDAQVEKDKDIADPTLRAKKLAEDKASYDSKEKMAGYENSSKIENIEDATAVMNLRNSGDQRGAGLLEIENKYKYDAEAAKGNDPLLKAIEKEKSAEILAFMQKTWGSSPEDAYWKSVGDIFAGGGFGGGKGAGLPSHDPLPGKPKHVPPGLHPPGKPNWVPPLRHGHDHDPNDFLHGVENNPLRRGWDTKDGVRNPHYEFYDPKTGTAWHRNQHDNGFPGDQKRVDRKDPGYQEKLDQLHAIIPKVTNPGADGVSKAAAENSQAKKDDAIGKFATAVDIWKTSMDNATPVILGDLTA